MLQPGNVSPENLKLERQIGLEGGRWQGLNLKQKSFLTEKTVRLKAHIQVAFLYPCGRVWIPKNCAVGQLVLITVRKCKGWNMFSILDTLSFSKDLHSIPLGGRAVSTLSSFISPLQCLYHSSLQSTVHSQTCQCGDIRSCGPQAGICCF